ncbi:hypothetical protein COW36_12990 [bacterium (Candidatus Blackallbacteria) CG17_big_fil_post_rev_8_21_14_2_50_48_46]|uniref:Uncharacterized protein n=1 Tax=bacterium (Candidatus Blackallbacteria) CG17_big_fil_post_rev_8_21_14_2_50_48_46 TaxID=2014261 RepID=A0A2M7G480_9BACT|nr:MAG: hypothetical protein COW64_02275 [bacterium (Candidatus Blackallbacteria) CG18_big_fil_WC_8_21_14_2_50_49_26]PIW16675.1 MAG: hypothetical protein COW36_12990 [bacterium (Candidatus Blackallbacteria) CG17_big_fil_post_rev_8_21_14_2_50_48_46]PIW46181.1 MAG: hypothetical protein COW20_18245 [bacterium (Candidatus Blackallbacteria) CG13_big_fil_rev_8_21_14_2_50_49_14]
MKVKTIAGLQVYIYTPCASYSIKEYSFDPIYTYIIFKNVSTHRYFDIPNRLFLNNDENDDIYLLFSTKKNNQGFKKMLSRFYIKKPHAEKQQKNHMVQSKRINEKDPRIDNPKIGDWFRTLLRPGESKIFVIDLRHWYTLFQDRFPATYTIKAKFHVSDISPNSYGTEFFNGELESNEIKFNTILIKNRKNPENLKIVKALKYKLLDFTLLLQPLY